jgi:hypothetical protein
MRMKYLIIILLLVISNNLYSQADTINDIFVLKGRAGIEEFCLLEKIKNKTYLTQIGHSYRRVVLANGWFKMDRTCPREINTLPIVECKFDKTQTDLYIKYKRGKLYSGRINDKDETYRIIGFCRKGLLHGKVKILDNEKNIVWEGEMIHGLPKNI